MTSAGCLIKIDRRIFFRILVLIHWMTWFLYGIEFLPKLSHERLWNSTERSASAPLLLHRDPWSQNSPTRRPSTSVDVQCWTFRRFLWDLKNLRSTLEVELRTGVEVMSMNSDREVPVESSVEFSRGSDGETGDVEADVEDKTLNSWFDTNLFAEGSTSHPAVGGWLSFSLMMFVEAERRQQSWITSLLLLIQPAVFLQSLPAFGVEEVPLCFFQVSTITFCERTSLCSAWLDASWQTPLRPLSRLDH